MKDTLHCAMTLLGILVLLGGCSPKEGSKEWCEKLMNKPTGQLTGNDLQHYEECLTKKYKK